MDRQIWDPLRKKNVALTPEEEVRQWFIGVLHEECGIPYHAMMSEASFKFGEKVFRTDIVVWDRRPSPAVVVECKRPDVLLDEKVLDQALRYDMVLEVRWIVITNGRLTAVLQRGENGFVRTGKMPHYDDITACGED